MKKILLYLCIAILLIANSFAFNVYNSDNKEQTYFSLNEDQVFVKSSSNSSLNINYKILEETKNKTYRFEKCSDEYCLDFYLSDLIENNQGSFISSDYFELQQQESTKKIYLDLEAPILEVTNTNINSEKKQITLTYNFSDDSLQISKIDFYEKKENNLNFIKEISKQNTITYEIEDARTYTFIFKIYDAAGNLEEIEKKVDVNDIFPPKIEKVFIIKENENYQIEFTLSDKNLTSYEIIQNSLTLSEDINNKQTFKKTLNIPFKSGDVTIKAIDANGNEGIRKLSLKSPISHTYRNKYSSSKTFEFKSNAEMCYLLSVDNERYNEEIDESSDDFKIRLDISSTKEYTLKYYCEKSNYREYFESAFYYDTNNPTAPEITAKQLSNGYVKIEWTESEDEESDVDYRLYRDNEKIYDGSKEDFEDNEVTYPNTYEYYVEAYDEAGNTESSEKISESPKKVKVTFETTLQDNLGIQNEKLKFNFRTDKNSNIDINVKNNNQTVDSQYAQNTPTEIQNFELKLSPGINQIEINIDDNLGNELKKTYFVTYNKPVQEEIEQKEITTEPIKEKTPVIQAPQNKSESNSTSEKTKEETASKNNWIWFLLILIIFAYFIWFFVLNEDKRKKSITILPNKKRNKKNKTRKTNKMPTVNFALSKDKSLEKDFNRIKKERIARQEERRKNDIRKKRLAAKQTKTTQLQKEKIEDLKNRREINIPNFTREKSKANYRRVQKEPSFEEDLIPTKEQTQEKKKTLWSRGKEIPKDDEFSKYIQRVKSTPSWMSPKEYIHQEPKPEPLKEEKETPTKTTLKENIETLPKKDETAQKPKIEKKKIDLDSYLNKRKKSRRLFLAEKSVDKDIRLRK